MNNMKRIHVCESGALSPGRTASVALDAGTRVAVFRLHTGELCALEDRCPHRGAALSEGIVYEDFVACRDHGWSICLRNGQVQAPERGSVRVFEVCESEGAVWLTGLD